MSLEFPMPSSDHRSSSSLRGCCTPEVREFHRVLEPSCRQSATLPSLIPHCPSPANVHAEFFLSWKFSSSSSTIFWPFTGHQQGNLWGPSYAVNIPARHTMCRRAPQVMKPLSSIMIDKHIFFLVGFHPHVISLRTAHYFPPPWAR